MDDRDFKDEVFPSYDPKPTKACRQCGRNNTAALKMLNPRTGEIVRIFKCPCGEQTWTEGKE